MTLKKDQPKRERGVALPLKGKQVSRCYVDFAFGIQFFEQEEVEIRIEGRFYLRARSKSDPERVE